MNCGWVWTSIAVEQQSMLRTVGAKKGESQPETTEA